MKYFIVNGKTDTKFPFTDFNNASDFVDDNIRTKLGVTYDDGITYDNAEEVNELYKTLLGTIIETLDFYDEDDTHLVQFTEFNNVIRSRISYYSKETGGNGLDVVIVFGK